MPDLESPDAFAARVCQPLSYDHDAVVAEIVERDAAVRREALSERDVCWPDLRDRLSLFAPLVCRECGCAPHYVRQEHCLDCWEVRRNYHGINGSGSHVSSCISVGLRALCGRRLLDGVAR